MKIKIFTIPIFNYEIIEVEMNNFLSTHKVLQVEKEFFSNNNEAFWCFYIKYLENANITDSDKNRNFKNKNFKRKPKVDYKEVLTEKQFETFSKLRETRKKISVEEAIPAYAVFTDEELSKIASLDEITITKIKTIDGIGDKKVEKYGKKIEETK